MIWRRCTSLTLKGEQCQRDAIGRSPYCLVHHRLHARGGWIPVNRREPREPVEIPVVRCRRCGHRASPDRLRGGLCAGCRRIERQRLDSERWRPGKICPRCYGLAHRVEPEPGSEVCPVCGMKRLEVA